MKRILSIFLLLAIAISLFAGVPAQAAGLPITSTEEDSIVPSPWDNALPETPDVSSIPEETLTYTAQEVAGTYSAKAADLPFSDVHSNAWYYDDVVYVYEAGIMLGVSDTKFAPNASLTRAEVVTVLYRLEGSPSVDGTSNFWDVPQDAYFADAVTWAARNGIVKGHIPQSIKKEMHPLLIHLTAGGVQCLFQFFHRAKQRINALPVFRILFPHSFDGR